MSVLAQRIAFLEQSRSSKPKRYRYKVFLRWQGKEIYLKTSGPSQGWAFYEARNTYPGCDVVAIEYLGVTYE